LTIDDFRLTKDQFSPHRGVAQPPALVQP